MGIFLADVEERRDAERATRHGMVASLVFAAMLTLGLVLIAATGGLPWEAAALDPTGRIFALVAITAELGVALFAAYRFWHKKGLVAGALTLLLFVIEILLKLTSGFVGILWYVVYLAIFLGLVNGVRGAWALRDAPEALPADVAQAFE